MKTNHPVIERFIEGYLQKQDYYRHVAELCHEHCHEALSQNGIRHIATFRAKGRDRLREKLYNRVATGHVYENDGDIATDIVDLAGARVAIYFPAELPNAVEALTSRFNVIEKRTFPQQNSKRRGQEIYPYRFPGYSAIHMLASIKQDTLPEDQRYYADARIEIQIASLLMHAWAEVEHDLIYKPLNGKLSIGEYSLLDQINGLALTGDVTLEQLQRTMKERIAREQRKYDNHYDLASHIHNAYRSGTKATEPLLGRVDRLLMFLQRTGLDAPALLDPYIASLPTAGVNASIVDQLRERIIASSPELAKERRQIWLEVEQTFSQTDLDQTENSRATAERRLKKHWTTFESMARQALTSRHPHQLARTGSTVTTQANFRMLGFDNARIKSLTEAQQAYVRVLSDQWTGTVADLEHHSDVIRTSIEDLCAAFPVLLADRSPR